LTGKSHTQAQYIKVFAPRKLNSQNDSYNLNIDFCTPRKEEKLPIYLPLLP